MTNSLHLPSLAMMMCVCDEAELLAANLTYHHQLGVARAYLFLDGCTDRTLEVAQSFHWVRVIEQDASQQTACMNLALTMAREEGVQWLMHIDADNFACGDERPHYLRIAAQRLGQFDAVCGNLQMMLGRVAYDTEMVMLQPMDALPTSAGDESRFWTQHYYQTGGILYPLVGPATGEIRGMDSEPEHNKGKSIIRTVSSVEAMNGQWKACGEERELRTENRGFHYRFAITSTPEPQAARQDDSASIETVQPRQLVWPMLKGQVIYDTFVEDTLRYLKAI